MYIFGYRQRVDAATGRALRQLHARTDPCGTPQMTALAAATDVLSSTRGN